MNELAPKTCLNCSNELQSAFCPQCGQPYSVSRLRLKSVLSEFFEKVIGLDSAFLRTITHLFVRPGKVAMTYIQGNRRTYMGPLAYFLLCTTIYILIVNVMGIEWSQYVDSTVAAFNQDVSEVDRAFTMAMVEFTNKVQRLMALVSSFFLAVPLWLIFRKEGKINFMEALAASLYVGAQSYILTSFSLLSFYTTGYGFQVIVSAGSFLLPCWLAATMFTKRVSWANFFKGLVCVILNFVLIMIAGVLFSVSVALIFGEEGFRLIGLGEFLDIAKQRN